MGTEEARSRVEGSEEQRKKQSIADKKRNIQRCPTCCTTESFAYGLLVEHAFDRRYATEKLDFTSECALKSGLQDKPVRER